MADKGLVGAVEPEYLKVCPTCGSPLVKFSSLIGGSAECGACHWHGKNDELLTVPHISMGSDKASILIAMRNDIRKVFSTNAIHFVRFLVKWGFVDAVQRGESIEVTDPSQAVRYMNVIAAAAMVAVVEEREKIEKEKAGG